MSQEVIDKLLDAREKVLAEGLAIMAQAAEENRDLSEEEDERIVVLREDAGARAKRLEAMKGLEAERVQADADRATHRDVLPARKPVSIVPGTPEAVYRQGGFGFFADLLAATKGDLGAMTRLNNHNQYMAQYRPEYRSWAGGAAEYRDGTTGATSYGAFIPPVFLLDEIAERARAGRVIPNIVRDVGAPTSTSISVPRITTGTATAIQTADNAALQETDIVTAQLTRATSTIGGIQDVSVQSVELSPMAVDRLIFGDLIADYNRALDSQCVIGTGASGQLLGLDALTGFNAVTYVDASPTVGELYSSIANAIQQVHTARFAPPDGIVMHPRRWGWFLAAVDSTGRPLVTPYAPMNNPARSDGLGVGPSFGPVGSLQGLPVYTDPNIPITLGGGTEDEIYVARFEDMLIMEGPLRSEVFRDVGSLTATVRFRVYAFCNLFVGRFPAGVSKITGTGLAAPVF